MNGIAGSVGEAPTFAQPIRSVVRSSERSQSRDHLPPLVLSVAWQRDGIGEDVVRVEASLGEREAPGVRAEARAVAVRIVVGGHVGVLRARSGEPGASGGCWRARR